MPGVQLLELNHHSWASVLYKPEEERTALVPEFSHWLTSWKMLVPRSAQKQPQGSDCPVGGVPLWDNEAACGGVLRVTPSTLLSLVVAVASRAGGGLCPPGRHSKPVSAPMRPDTIM